MGKKIFAILAFSTTSFEKKELFQFIIMLNRILIVTEDGSHSIFVPQLNEHFHSIHGSIQEANHVFIKNGLHVLNKSDISILEIGFGTGLNALLTYFETQQKNLKVNYTAIEAFPINELEFKELNYCNFINQPDCQKVFNSIFNANWNEKYAISQHFNLLKIKKTFQEIDNHFKNEVGKIISAEI